MDVGPVDGLDEGVVEGLTVVLGMEEGPAEGITEG